MSEGAESPRRLGRQLSARSDQVFQQLEACAELLAAKEKRFGELVIMARNSQNDKETLLKIKNELAIMNGEVDKIQMNHIDSILVGELVSGKDDAKLNRKDLNKRAVELSNRIKEFHAAISQGVQRL